MLTHLGSLTLGQCVPLAARASASIAASVAFVLPSLTAKLEGLLALQASLTLTPPSLAANLQAAIDLVAALEASVALGLPGVDFQLAAVAAVIAQVQADLGAIGVEASFQVELDIILGTPGVHAYFYTGRADQLGPELANATTGGFPGGRASDECVAWVFAASDGGAIAAARQVFA